MTYALVAKSYKLVNREEARKKAPCRVRKVIDG